MQKINRNLSPPSSLPTVKQINMEHTNEESVLANTDQTNAVELDPISNAAENASLQKALGPLITEFQCL